MLQAETMQDIIAWQVNGEAWPAWSPVSAQLDMIHNPAVASSSARLYKNLGTPRISSDKTSEPSLQDVQLQAFAHQKSKEFQPLEGLSDQGVEMQQSIKSVPVVQTQAAACCPADSKAYFQFERGRDDTDISPIRACLRSLRPDTDQSGWAVFTWGALLQVRNLSSLQDLRLLQ